VLADVFNTNREPIAPATPKSWSTAPKTADGAQPAAASAAPADQSPASAGKGAGGAPSARHGKGLFSSRKATVHEAPKAGAGQKHNAWGAFSNRKAQTPGQGHSQGNESTIWSEITRSSRPKAIPHHKPRAGSPGQQGGKPKPVDAAAEQDFWGELESRVAGFKGRRAAEGEEEKPKRFASRGPKTPRDVTDPKSAGKSVPAKPSAHPAAAREEPEKQRRKSRFELEEESKAEDRRSKKPKKAQRGRRMEDAEDWDDEAIHRWEQKQRRQAEKEARKQAALQQEQAAVPIFLPEYISASNLGQALKQRSEQFMKDMEDMGFENVTSDTIMTGETAALIAMEYGFEPTVDTGSQRDLRARPAPEDVTALPGRPPVVTIMGHVDHGKTTLLDWLRKSSIAAQEHGGITQHIGAFIVKMSSGKAITFLDTPGHAAFLSMRQRGANVTDIVVLVVAADDSVMPQTVEALKHATAAKVPIIVAINKIDKEDARVDQVKADLARHGVEIEDFGGDVQVVCVSGKTGQGMSDLEENIITLSEILDVRAETDGMAEGWILESSVKQNGKTATVLVKRGTLRPGDLIVAGKTWAKIRVLRNEAGTELPEAPPGTPVEILGWRELPDAGEQVLQAPDEAMAKTAVEYRLEMAERQESSNQLAEQEQRQREKAAAEAAQQAVADADGSAASQTEPGEPGILYQNFTVKADVAGSVEAVCGSILELGNNEVRPKILRSSAGQISEYDIDHAAASNSAIVNFNVPILPHIKQRAEEAKVKILDHTVIYHVVDDVKSTLSDLLPETVTFRVSGEADVLQIFPINVKKRTFRNIAGCRVRNGAIKKSSRVKVLRKGKVVFDGKFANLPPPSLPQVHSLADDGENCVLILDFFARRPDRHAQARQKGRRGDGQGHRVRHRPRGLRRLPGRRPDADVRGGQGEAHIVRDGRWHRRCTLRTLCIIHVQNLAERVPGRWRRRDRRGVHNTTY